MIIWNCETCLKPITATGYVAVGHADVARFEQEPEPSGPVTLERFLDGPSAAHWAFHHTECRPSSPGEYAIPVAELTTTGEVLHWTHHLLTTKSWLQSTDWDLVIRNALDQTGMTTRPHPKAPPATPPRVGPARPHPHQPPARPRAVPTRGSSMRLTDDQYTALADRVGRAAANELAPLIEGWLSPAETPIRSGQTWTNHLDKSVRIAGQVDTAAGAQPLGALWVADVVDALFGRRWLVTDAWLAECGYELAEESA